MDNAMILSNLEKFSWRKIKNSPIINPIIKITPIIVASDSVINGGSSQAQA